MMSILKLYTDHALFETKAIVLFVITNGGVPIEWTKSIDLTNNTCSEK
jgi:hypothetical protein